MKCPICGTFKDTKAKACDNE
ncbi:hypothetical protein LL280_06305 [Enterococcus gallinarum]|nr:hypothetical protein [Enterococcus gallinarum]